MASDLAFEYWYYLGPRRSINRVAKHFSVSHHLVHRWVKDDRWDLKAGKRDRELIEELSKEHARYFIERRLELAKLVRSSIQHWEELAAEDKVGPTKVADLEKLIRLEMDLLGIAKPVDGPRTPEGLDYDTMVMELQRERDGVQKHVTVKLEKQTTATRLPNID